MSLNDANDTKRKKKRSKAYYVGSVKRQKKFGQCRALDVNQKGFFITCGNGSGRAKACVNEAYTLLGQFADILYGPEEFEIDKKKITDKVDDVEAQIANEIESLNQSTEAGTSERRFQAVDCGVKNCVFIRTKILDPCELAFKVLDDIRTTGKSVARYMCRLTPVSITCRAYVDDIRKAAGILLPKYFKNTGIEDCGSGGRTYCIVFKARCNKNVSREAVHEALNPIVQNLNPANTVELKTPHLVIVVEVLSKICCLAVVAEYFQLRKYNVVEMATPTKAPVKTVSSEENHEESDMVAVADAPVLNEAC